MSKFLVFALLGALIVPSCSKQEKQDKIETVYERTDFTALKGKPFSPMLNDYTSKIVKLGYDHDLLIPLRKNARFIEISKTLDLDVTHIQKHSYAYDNDLQIIYVPIKNKTRVLVIYNKGTDFAFLLSTESILPDGNRHVEVARADNPSSLYYEVQLNKQSKFGKFVSHNPIILGVREMSSVAALPSEVPSYDTPVDEARGCCSKPFNQCMNCFIASCNNDWVCGAACLGLAYWCIGAWGAACATGVGCSRAF